MLKGTEISRLGSSSPSSGKRIGPVRFLYNQ
jgi:hypothetical protein